MDNNFKEWIGNLEKHQIALEKVRRQEKILLSPVLTDLTHIDLIFRWVEDICREEPQVNTHDYEPKHYFFVIIALLYSPRVFAGDFLPRGQREVIARAVRLSPTHVSASIRSTCGWSKLYKDFQESLDYIYEVIQDRIEERGWK